MNETTKGILIMTICLLIIGSSITYVCKAIRDNNYKCEEGDIVESMETEDHLFLECGIEEESTTVKEIEGNKIVEHKIITKEGNSHIETKDRNWTDNDWVAVAFMISVLVSMVCMAIMLAWIMQWVKRR